MKGLRDEVAPHAPALSNNAARTESFLIHLEVCNQHRLPRAVAIARTLAAGGHDAAISFERRIAVRLSEEYPTLSWCAENVVARWRKRAPDVRIRGIDVFCGEDEDALAATQARRAEAVAALLSEEAPSYLMLWGGNFSYQAGTLEGAAHAGYAERLIFFEVGWLPQQATLTFDRQGVNSRSSLVGLRPGPLQPGQREAIRAARARFRLARCGPQPPTIRPRSVFAPLQIETDTSFKLGSPFLSNADFVRFLADWLPEDCAVVAKLHPKDRIIAPPLGPPRENFQILKGGALDRMLLPAAHVVGINSTVLIEAAMLGKHVVALGAGLFSGTGLIHEADPEDQVEAALAAEIDEEAREAFLFELVFRRQVSLAALERRDYDHLASRAPFSEILPPRTRAQRSGRLRQNATNGVAMIRVGGSRVARTAILDVEKGGEIVIGDDSEVRHSAVLEVSGRYNGSIRIGDHSVIGVGSWLQGSGEIDIGDDVIIGPYAAIVSTNHQFADVDTPIARQPLTTGKIVIENDVWLGAHVTVAMNVRIGAHSIIGANSFVNKDIPPYSVAVGSPARVIRSRK